MSVQTFNLHTAWSPPVLGAAFERLLGAGGIWQPGLPMDVVRLRPAKHLLQLSHDLHAGSYRPSPVRRFCLSKADGSQRQLAVYAVRDRVVQRALLTVVQPLGEQLFLDCSYGFRPGLTVAMACCRVREWVRQGYAWLVDADIARCFEQVPRTHALNLLAALAPPPAVRTLVAQWIAAADPPGVSAERGLPQGMALSPLLCNLVLHRFDLAMRRAAIPMVRYADDFVLLAQRRSEAHAARAIAVANLAPVGLAMHPGKTRVTLCSQDCRFLGQRLPRRDLALAWSQP